MLEARNINYSVGHRTIISDVSVTFECGGIGLIIGPNGAGKSTLVKLLAGFLRPQTGTVTYAGKNVLEITSRDMARHRAVLSQAIEMAFPLTVREVVMMGRYPHFGSRPAASDEAIVHEMMCLFEVDEFSDRNYQTLSGGERQRVNFARILGQLWRSPDQSSVSGLDRRYLFLDEPLTFLDIRHQIDFMKKVRSFAEARDVVTVGVVHDLDLAARFADHLVLLDRGEMIAAGTPTEVLTPANIRRVFGVEPKFIAIEGSGTHLFLD